MSSTFLRCAQPNPEVWSLVWSGKYRFQFPSSPEPAGGSDQYGPCWNPRGGPQISAVSTAATFTATSLRKCWSAGSSSAPSPGSFRLHGFREPIKEPIGTTGGGRQPIGAVTTGSLELRRRSYEISKKYMEIREKIRPLFKTLMQESP